jgi:hypothetical protein
MSTFANLQALSSTSKTITLADPDDIIESIPKWSDEQLKVRIEDRGSPIHGYKIEIRPGAPTFEFKVRRLTSAEREVCDRVIDAVQPPEKLEPKRMGPGQEPVNVRVGFDEDDPKFLSDLRVARCNQQALICLFGVEGLMESVEGDNHPAKIEKLRASLDEHIIRILAGEIWGRTYSAGDPADFFTSANSPAATPSSASSQSKKPPGRKQK